MKKGPSLKFAHPDRRKTSEKENGVQVEQEEWQESREFNTYPIINQVLLLLFLFTSFDLLILY